MGEMSEFLSRITRRLSRRWVEFRISASDSSRGSQVVGSDFASGGADGLLVRQADRAGRWWDFTGFFPETDAAFGIFHVLALIRCSFRRSD